MALFRHQLFLLAILLLTMLLQFQIVWDIESKLLNYSPFEVASILFIPHGVKAIMVVLSGAKAIVPIFLAHLVTDLAIGLGALGGVLSGGAAVASMMLPLVLINFITHKRMFAPLASEGAENFSLFRLVIFTAVVSSLLNSIIGALRYGNSPVDLTAFKFFTGDVGGTLFVLALLIMLKKPLIKLAHAVGRMS